MSNFSADHTIIGYYYQSMYALYVLLLADDDSSVSLETDDDVVLSETNVSSLMQIKHSQKSDTILNTKSLALWKTIRIWIESGLRQNTNYVLITCASIKDDDPLQVLTNLHRDCSNILTELNKEADRVVEAVKQAELDGITEPYKDKYPGCLAYANLTQSQRKSLVDNILIISGNFSITEMDSKISEVLKNSTTVQNRSHVVEMLMDWWDALVFKSILNKRDRNIHKYEVQTKLHEILGELLDDSLPDYYSTKQPEDVNSEIGTIMAKQIQIVDGGLQRIQRGAIARWRARNQRNKWLELDISLINLLDNYDNTLIDVWNDHHAPLKEDLENQSEQVKKDEGKKLLDWSHFNASQEIPPPRPNWSQPFYVQGMYQQLSEEMKVGWHPNYVEKLSEQ